MRNLTPLAVAAVFFSGFGVAAAADLGRASPSLKDDIYTPAPVYSWTGFYIGANGGYGWGGEHQQVVGVDIAHWDFSPSGGLAGGQVGFNAQSGGLVFGVEGTADWSGIGASTRFVPPIGGSHESITDLRAIADISGRLGVALDRTLVYAKGGAAWGWFDHDYIVRGNRYTSDTETQVGWLVGGGVEVALSGNWTAKAEYNYIDFGKGTFTLNGPVVQAADFQDTVHIVKGGLNYKFGSRRDEPLK